MIVKLNNFEKTDEFDYNDDMDENTGGISPKAQPETFYHQNLMTSEIASSPFTPSPMKESWFKKKSSSFANVYNKTFCNKPYENDMATKKKQKANYQTKSVQPKKMPDYEEGENWRDFDEGNIPLTNDDTIASIKEIRKSNTIVFNIPNQNFTIKGLSSSQVKDEEVGIMNTHPSPRKWYLNFRLLAIHTLYEF